MSFVENEWALGSWFLDNRKDKQMSIALLCQRWDHDVSHIVMHVWYVRVFYASVEMTSPGAERELLMNYELLKNFHLNLPHSLTSCQIYKPEIAPASVTIY